MPPLSLPLRPRRRDVSFSKTPVSLKSFILLVSFLLTLIPGSSRSSRRRVEGLQSSLVYMFPVCVSFIYTLIISLLYSPSMPPITFILISTFTLKHRTPNAQHRNTNAPLSPRHSPPPLPFMTPVRQFPYPHPNQELDRTDDTNDRVGRRERAAVPTISLPTPIPSSTSPCRHRFHPPPYRVLLQQPLQPPLARGWLPGTPQRASAGPVCVFSVVGSPRSPGLRSVTRGLRRRLAAVGGPVSGLFL